jgi:hypothetical protein
LFLVGSVPVTLFVTVRVSLMAAARANRNSAAKKKQAVEEEA